MIGAITFFFVVLLSTPTTESTVMEQIGGYHTFGMCEQDRKAWSKFYTPEESIKYGFRVGSEKCQPKGGSSWGIKLYRGMTDTPSPLIWNGKGWTKE